MKTIISRVAAVWIALMLVVACDLNPSPSSTPIEPTTTPTPIVEVPAASATPTSRRPATPIPTLTALPTQAPTPTLAPMGQIQPLQPGYVYLGDTSTIALGFDLSAGGAIGSMLYYGADYIDDTDLGRYVQFSPYDGGDQYSCDTIPCTYTPWGWNPLQAGSVDGVPAPVREYRRWEDGLYIKAQAMEWGHDLGVSDVIYETWAWDRGGFFEVHIRLTHTGTDTHTLALAEFPAAYFGAAVTLPYGYFQADPFMARPIQQQARTRASGPAYASESWMAFGDQQGNGLILALPPYPYAIPLWYVFTIEGDTPSPLGYIAPNLYLETGPLAVHDLIYYLIPGPIAQSRSIVYDLVPHTTWTFDLNTAEGWVSSGQPAAISGGILTAHLSPADAMTSMPALNFHGSHAPAVEINARAASGAADVCLNFVTVRVWIWTVDNSACQKIGSGAFRDYRFDLSTNPAWADGLVTQIQLVALSPSAVEIDQIRVSHELYGWEFDHPQDAAGWLALNDLLPLQFGVDGLSSTSTGSDPYLISPYLGVKAAEFSQIEIRMRATSVSDIAEVFFITDQDPNWDGNKMQPFPTLNDGEFHVYAIDMSAAATWQNQILQLRLDPMNSPGDFEIDYLRVARP